MKKILMAAAIAGAFVAAPTFAQGYIGGGIGAGRARLDNNTFTVAPGVNASTSANDSTNTSGKILGGWQITPHWGVEAQYVWLGKTDFSITTNVPGVGGSGSYRAESFGVAATGTLPIANNFYLMGKLGAAFNRVRGGNACVTAGVVTSCSNLGNDNKTDLLAGVGAGYNFNPHWGLRLEYENFGKMTKNNGGNGGSVKGDNWALSVKYSF